MTIIIIYGKESVVSEYKRSELVWAKARSYEEDYCDNININFSIKEWYRKCVRQIYDKVGQRDMCLTRDMVVQLVRCQTSKQRVAGSIPGRGTLVCPWARQFIPYCFSLPSCKIRQCLQRVRYMLPVALEYPPGDWNGFRVYMPARGGRSCMWALRWIQNYKPNTFTFMIVIVRFQISRNFS